MRSSPYISGELFLSWLYLIFDIVQVLLAATVAVFVEMAATTSFLGGNH